MRRIAIGLLAAVFHSICLAQDDAVLIEATRFPDDVRRLPASTTVIPAQDIARSAARTLPELLAEQVGITIKDFFGNNASTTSIDLRGFGVTGPQNTLILVDGRRQNDLDLSGVQWAAIPLASIERIEILRGTGAVLYGDAASAGVVNIVTRSPLKQGPNLEAFARVATFSTTEGQLLGSYAVGQFGINASVYDFSSDGYRRNNRNEQQNNSINLRWGLGDGALDFRAGTDRQRTQLPGARRIRPSTGLDEYSADPRGAQTPLDYSSRDGRRAGVALTKRLWDAEFSVGLDRREKDQRAYFDQGGFPASQANTLALNSLTPRLRVPFSLAGIQHRLVIGADWHEWRYRSRRTDRPQNFDRPTNRVSVDQRTSGLYLQDAIQLTSTTLVTLGWRRERAQYTAQDMSDSTAPGCAFPPCAAAPAASEKQSGKAWELGLRQRLAAEWSGFARAGRSFRFVNAEEIYENNAAFAPQFQILRPQNAITHEGGVEWRRGGHSVRATLFRTDVSDEIHLDPFTTGVGNTNLPPSRRQGLELEAAWQARPALKFLFGYAYTDARFLEGVINGRPFSFGTDMPIAGRTVPLVPLHKLNAGIRWDLTPKTRFSAMLTSLSSQVLDTDEPNTLGRSIPSYATLDAKLTQDIGKGRLSLAVNNLFNKHYYNYAVRSFVTRDLYSVYPLPGRTVALTAELALP